MKLRNTPKGANLVFLIIVLVNIGVSLLSEILMIFGIDIFFGSMTVQLLISQVVFILPVLIFMLCTRTEVKIFRFKKINFVNILLCIVMYLCLSPVLTFLNTISMLYSSNMISDVMLRISDEVPFIVGLLLIAIIPAFFEEMTYRGFFYNTYRETSPFGAIIMCGLLFGLVHGNLNQFTYAFVLGMMFALIVEATDSLWSTIIVHFLINMSSVAVIYLLPIALGALEKVYDSCIASGNTEIADLITGLMGTTDFSIESVLGLNAGPLPTSTILMAILTNSIPAAIGAVLAFLLYRKVAKRCGRWDHIRYLFMRKSKKVQQTQAAEQPAEADQMPAKEDAIVTDTFCETVEPEIPLKPVKKSLISWEFIVGTALMGGLMIINEIAMRLMAG